MPFPSLQASPFPKTHDIEIGPVNNPTRASKYLSEREHLISLSLNQKLKVIKFSEEGMLKIRVGWRPGVLSQPTKLWMQRYSSWRSFKELLQWTQEWQESNTSLLLVHVCFSGVQLCVTPWTVARQTLLSMGFSRQECWSGLPCLLPGDLPHSGIRCKSLKSP